MSEENGIQRDRRRMQRQKKNAKAEEECKEVE